VFTSAVRARTNHGSRPDHGQVGLCFRAAMFHRRRQLRIDPGQPCQRLRIQTIVFLSTLSDQAQLARMGHDHFVPQLAQQPVLVTFVEGLCDIFGGSFDEIGAEILLRISREFLNRVEWLLSSEE
jgi:hypothetical protein